MIRRMCCLLAVFAASSVLGETSWNELEYIEPDDEVRSKIEGFVIQDPKETELHYFKGPGGLIGVGITSLSNGRQMVAYASNDGSMIFAGAALDTRTKENVSNIQAGLLPLPDLGAIFDKLDNAVMITEGNPDSDNHYYVFFDPQCGFCHQTYTAFYQARLEADDFAVHYIPVGVLSARSENLSKEILGAEPNLRLALLRRSLKKDGHSINAATAAAGEAGFQNNQKLFLDTGGGGVPVIWSDIGGRQVIHGSGAMSKDTIVAMLQDQTSELASR